MRDDRYHLPLLVLLTAAVFAPTLGFPLLDGWDDQRYILQNTEGLRGTAANLWNYLTSLHFYNYHPVTMYSYMLDYTVGGTTAWPYRVQSLGWHLVAAAGLYQCARALPLAPGAALLVALVWAVHPQRVESVVWVSERKDVLFGAFGFWGCWVYLARPRARVLAWGLLVLAVLAKAMAVGFPFLLLAWEWWQAGGQARRVPWRRLLPFFTVLLVVLPTAFVGQTGAIRVDEPLWRRFALVAHNLAWYAEQTLWPLGLNPMYPRVRFTGGDWLRLAVFWGALAAGLALWAVHAERRRQWRLALPLLLAYPAALGPMLGLFSLGPVDLADRHSYLPSAVLLVLAALGGCWLAARWPALARPAVRWPAGVAVVLALVASTLAYSRHWGSTDAVLARATTRDPANSLALGTRATRELWYGNYEQVHALADRLLHLDPRGYTPAGQAANRVRAHYLHGVALVRAGRFAEALPWYDAVVLEVRQPGADSALDVTAFFLSFGEANRHTGRWHVARLCYDEVLRRDPALHEARLYRGMAALKLGYHAAAVADLRACLAAAPQDLSVAALLAEAERAGTRPER